MKKKILTAISAATGMLMLILDGKTALSGAAEGIGLCIRAVVPSLFPFLVLSGLLTANLSGFRWRFLGPLCRWLGIPQGGEGLLTVSFFGGYPLGAQTVAQYYHQGQISRSTARRLLMFCSNAGPAFIFGIVGPQFSAPAAAWALWLIGILSSLLLGALAPGKCQETIHPQESSLSLTDALGRSVAVMAQICGWVVLFRIFTAFLDCWLLWLLPEGWRCFLSGLLELTVGCCCLGSIENEALRFIAAAVLLHFGGLCVWLQTASVVGELGTGCYLKGKLQQALVCGLLAWLLTQKALLGMVILVLTAVIFREMQKRGSNSAPVGV